MSSAGRDHSWSARRPAPPRHRQVSRRQERPGSM